MDKHDLRTIIQESKRFLKDIKVTKEENVYKLELPFVDLKGKPLYFFINKHNETKKFMLMMPVESAGILATQSSLAILQKVAATFTVMLTQDAVLVENTKLSLHIRIQNMTHLLLAIDGIKRLWKVTYATESQSN